MRYSKELRANMKKAKKYPLKNIYKNSKFKPVMNKERWICSDGTWGGWYIYQCGICSHYIPTWFIETKKGQVDKRVKRCRMCGTKVKIDNKIYW